MLLPALFSQAKQIWGLKGLEEVTRQSKYPVTAIGGITIHPDTYYGVESNLDKSLKKQRRKGIRWF